MGKVKNSVCPAKKARDRGHPRSSSSPCDRTLVEEIIGLTSRCRQTALRAAAERLVR